MTRAAALLAAACLLAGCRTVVEPRSDELDEAGRRAVYQTIADSLPRADLGWGSPPGVVGMAASERGADPPEPPPLRANEQGFLVHYELVRPRSVWIPYGAIEEVSVGYPGFPNGVLVPFLFVPFQLDRLTVVFDSAKVPGFYDDVLAGIERLERISQEVGLGGPWSHAQTIKAKLNADAEAWGRARVSLAFDWGVPVPSAIPTDAWSREAAGAFAWVMAHPDAETLPDEEPAPEDEAAGEADPDPDGAGQDG